MMAGANVAGANVGSSNYEMILVAQSAGVFTCSTINIKIDSWLVFVISDTYLLYFIYLNDFISFSISDYQAT